MRIQEKKIELQKKVYRRICVRDITFLATRPSSYVIICRTFRLFISIRLLQLHVEKKDFAPENKEGRGGKQKKGPGGPVHRINRNGMKGICPPGGRTGTILETFF